LTKEAARKEWQENTLGSYNYRYNPKVMQNGNMTLRTNKQVHTSFSLVVTAPTPDLGFNVATTPPPLIFQTN